MEAMPRVTVIISTFNGERYIAEQLSSIAHQNYNGPIKILVRDDGSSDRTIKILKSFVPPSNIEITVFSGKRGRLGPKNSFAALLNEADTGYVAFCDQDDVWLSSKLQKQVEALRVLENDLGANTPLMCCSDATVTDDVLNATCTSFFVKHKLNFDSENQYPLGRLIFQNCAIGATSMMNRALVAICKQIPADAIMHDWWAALVASVLGKLIIINEPLILYRQHNTNVLGSKRRAIPRSMSAMREYVDLTATRTRACVRQARALNRLLSVAEPTAHSSDIVEEFAMFASISGTRRLAILLRRGAFKRGWLLNAVHLYVCARLNADHS